MKMRVMMMAALAATMMAGPALATTNAGAAPTPDPAFAPTTNAEIFAPFSDMQFGNGRTMPFSVARDPGLTSSGIVPSALTSDGPLAGVPEPTAWTMLVAGFGLVGLMTRRRKTAVSA